MKCKCDFEKQGLECRKVIYGCSLFLPVAVFLFGAGQAVGGTNDFLWVVTKGVQLGQGSEYGRAVYGMRPDGRGGLIPLYRPADLPDDTVFNFPQFKDDLIVFRAGEWESGHPDRGRIYRGELGNDAVIDIGHAAGYRDQPVGPFRWVPGGEEILFSNSSQGISRMDLDPNTDDEVLLTNNYFDEVEGVRSDNHRILFSNSLYRHPGDIFTMNFNGGDIQPFDPFPDGTHGRCPSLSPDNSMLAVSRSHGNSGIWLADASSATLITPIDQPLADDVPERGENNGWVAWSPDSRYVGYVNNSRLYSVRATPGSQPLQLETDDATNPRVWGTCDLRGDDEKLEEVPRYVQLPDQCGPTSAAMMLGYLDNHGYPTLVGGPDGAANTQTEHVEAMIDEIAGVPFSGAKHILAYQMRKYAESRGVRALSVWSWVSSWPGFDYDPATLLTMSIDEGFPAMMKTTTGGEGHYMAVEGYSGYTDPDTGEFTLTELHAIDPAAGKAQEVFWSDDDDFPVLDTMIFWPLSEPVRAPMNVCLGGSFDSEEELDLFTVDASGPAQGAEIVVLPGTIDRHVLALTTDGPPVSLKQNMPLAVGDGFTLGFEYLLPPDSKLEVLLHGTELATFHDETMQMTSFHTFVDTAAWGLDPAGEHELELRFSSLADPTLFVDNLIAVVRPIPEPSAILLLAMGAVSLLAYTLRGH